MWRARWPESARMTTGDRHSIAAKPTRHADGRPWQRRGIFVQSNWLRACVATGAAHCPRSGAIPLWARHRFQVGQTAVAPSGLQALPPVVQPLVLRHPRTGRKSIYVASHASHIVDMEVANGRLLLMELIERATRGDKTYRHEWQVGDLVLWNNRRSMHRGDVLLSGNDW